MKHLATSMHLHTRFRIRKFLKYVCVFYSCLSDVIVSAHVTMSFVERLVSFFEFLCAGSNPLGNSNQSILQPELGVLSVRLFGVVYKPEHFLGGYISLGATSNGKMKHLAISMHLHTRFRIRKILKYVCAFYSCLSDVIVSAHVTMFVVERLVPFSSFCVLGQIHWVI